MGEEAIQHCRTYAYEAERRMGELLAQTKRAKRGPDKETTQRSQAVTSEPTLAELGITRNESSRAQKLAALPLASFEAVRDGLERFNEVRREIKRAEVQGYRWFRFVKATARRAPGSSRSRASQIFGT